MTLEGIVTGYRTMETTGGVWLQLNIRNEDGLYERRIPTTATLGETKLIGRGLINSYVCLIQNSTSGSYLLQVAENPKKGMNGHFSENVIFLERYD